MWQRIFTDKNEAASFMAPVFRSILGGDSLGRMRYYLEKPDAITAQLKEIDFAAIEYTDNDELISALRQSLGNKNYPGVKIESLGWFIKSEGDKQKTGRLGGKIALVTGAAQGFGAGIAQLLASQGAYVVIADIKLDQAEEVASSINSELGPDTAEAIFCDVSDESSVSRLVEKTTLSFGGVDILISNAGVLKAGGLEDMTVRDFEFVTKINYTAFFLMTKYAARPMRLQAKADPQYSADIIQINSKSGLEGSNRNFAYAGSKFGGIGLVQSFARELVENRIKVNAICPGNFYEGPLWSDPERGLFVQYLKSGKVPGARTIEEVREFYVSKVPMRRGCMPEDVVRAIMYCVEQQYETGQAIPVTGGQVMLS